MSKKLLQECMFCGHKVMWYPKDENEEHIIRAACLPCGHQGMFTLEEIKDEQED